MRIADHRRDDHPEINLIPLIDVILVLVIFFVVTTTFDSRAVLRLQLPQAQGEPAGAQAKVLTVLVNAQGHYLVGDREPLRNDVDGLKRTLLEVAGNDRNRPVLLRADARSSTQAVITALDALGQLGFRQVSFATAPSAPPAR
jgi:biopolymer transport protein ExbD